MISLDQESVQVLTVTEEARKIMLDALEFKQKCLINIYTDLAPNGQERDQIWNEVVILQEKIDKIIDAPSIEKFRADLVAIGKND